MAAKSTRYWRMAFRAGPGGTDYWKECCKQGVAAISWTGDGQNLSNWEQCEFEEPRHGERPGSWKGSLGNFLFEMKEGDTIYAKSARCIVGKGIITSHCRYRDDILKLRTTDYASNFRKVKWCRGFVPIPADLAPQTLQEGHVRLTLYRLQERHITELRKAEKAVRHEEERRTTEAHRQRVQERKRRSEERKRAVEEGRQEKREITWRTRNRQIIDERKQAVGKCEVCAFTTEQAFGDLKRTILIAHHLKPFAGSVGPRKTKPEDIAIVCPNCHQAMHTETPPLTVKALIEKLQFSPGVSSAR